ncbi:MAG TPA: glycosyltransferase [Lacunisphaera sp.]|nr:glycosyltransferase [Lacunisphaera sp.]
MPGRSILILTSAHLCRNPRVVKEATTLGRAGYDVTVMSISVQSRFERMDRELMRGLPFKRVVLDYAGDTSLGRIADFCQRGATWAARQLCSRLGIESAQTLGPASALLAFARSFPADLTIVHTEIPIWAAQYLIRDGRKVAVDVEDWYSEDLLYADRLSRPIRLLRDAEEFVLRNAAYSSATAQSMANALVGAYQCPPPIVIRNSFPLQPRSRVDAPAAGGTPKFIWFSQTIGPGRGLELFFAAWARTTKPSQVYLLGDERGGYREKLLGRLPPGRRGDLHFIPLVTPEELPGKLAEFDIGLALEPRWPLNRNITITNKILQYMNAGLALIATDTAGQKEVMAAAPDAGLLITAHETHENAGRLDHLIGDAARLRATQEASRAAATREFCWEQETPRLLAAVARALG